MYLTNDMLNEWHQSDRQGINILGWALQWWAKPKMPLFYSRNSNNVWRVSSSKLYMESFMFIFPWALCHLFSISFVWYIYIFNNCFSIIIIGQLQYHDWKFCDNLINTMLTTATPQYNYYDLFSYFFFFLCYWLCIVSTPQLNWDK